MARFAHLHCHSHFSLLESNARPAALVDAAKAANQERIALTDAGNLFGAIQFYKAAQEKGVTPILGCELTIAAEDHRVKDPKQPTYPLTLLVENQAGYRNLIKLVSAGYREGFYFRPRVDKALLAKHADGLICLSGDLTSELSRRILAGDDAGAKRVIGAHREIFGPDRYFLEVMDTEIALQRKQREGLLELAQSTGTPALLTNDVRYLKTEDAVVREVIQCIASSKTLADENRWHLDTDKQYFRSTEEMASLFRGADRLCEQAWEVASRCNLALRFDEFHLPQFEVPTGEPIGDYFRRSCIAGCEALYGGMRPELQQRLEYEMGVIEKMGFVAYFLIVADFMRWAREHGVPVGPGRGSAAGSIVAYSLRITDVDPLKYDLLFERFLNAGRISMPDIDIDFCRDKRGLVIDYVKQKYGENSVCQIVTFGTLAAKAAIRDTGRVLGIDREIIDSIAKKIPVAPHVHLKDAIEGDPELKALGQKDKSIEELYRIALSIEGLNRHTSTHAAGVVITDKDLTEYVPLCVVQGEVNTQYAMGDLEAIGLLKMDFLGLKTLTIVARAEELIRETVPGFTAERLPLDDRATYEMLQRGEATGVFQLESSGMRDLLTKLKPDNFEDIVAILALYRPGPLGSGMVDSFVNRKHGREPIEYAHPSLEPILQATYGVMVYQEQIMRISNVLGGFSLEDADNLRKAMGKKKPEVMEKFRGRFVKGAIERGATEAVAAGIWEMMAFFAGYGFNKSHTVAYGLVTYCTAWLKANHPREYLAACMSIDRGDTDKVAVYLEECRQAEIAVHVPDINQSELDFAIRGGGIRFGLGAIKGVGEKAVEAILQARRRLERPFHSFLEVFEEVPHRDINKAAFERLVAAGAFDCFGAERSRLTTALDSLMRAGTAHQSDRERGQGSLFGGARAKNGEPARFALPKLEEWPLREKLRREKEALGFYLSDHPLKQNRATLKRFATKTLADLPGLEDKSEASVAGTLTQLREIVVKKGRSAGKKMAMFKVSGFDGPAIDAVCFAEDFDKIRQQLEDDAVGIFHGTIDKRGEEPSLRVINFEPLEQILGRRVQRVIVQLAAPDDTLLLGIRAVAEKHSGDTPLYLTIGDEQSRQLVRCGSKWKVAVTEEALEAFGKVVGSANVVCI